MRRRNAFSLVEILVVVAILAIIAAVIYPVYLRGGKTRSGKTIESPTQRAHSVECAANIQQIRQAYTMATSSEENRPQTLADLRVYGVSDSMTRCPVGGEPYQFNPATGEVRCVHPGH